MIQHPMGILYSQNIVTQFKNGALIETAILAVGVIACVSILIIVCIPSQLLIDAGDEVGFSCYSSGWYQWSPKNRLIFLMTMKRTLIPSGWIAGPGIILNFKTVAIVMKTGMSYITAILSLDS
ncbi:hypothetical protein TKK_0003343 [Trichogramma kaykai]